MPASNYSDIDLQALMSAPPGEMQSTEPAPFDPGAEMESPIAEPEDPKELKLKDVTLMDIVNFILGKYEMSKKLKDALQKVPDEATPIVEETPLAGDEEGYGSVPADEILREMPADEPMAITGPN